MKLGIEVEPYRRRLATPLVTSRGELAERAGFFVRLVDSDGQVGWGEAAPVYWIDDDPLDATGACLRPLHGRSVDVDAIGSLDDVRTTILAITGARSVPPLRTAARAAVETAVLDLAARRRGIAVATLLGGAADAPVAVNALVVAADPSDVAREVRHHVANGVRAIKLKVGACAPATDAERVCAAARATGGAVPLRLDANRAWSFAVAKTVLDAVPPGAIDYVEEPLSSPSVTELARLRIATGVGIAVDESLDALGGISALAAGGACDVVVLKPARVGGPLSTLALAREARGHGLRAVLTDSIETAVGRSAVVHTAAALLGAPEAIGLGGRRLLDAEPLHSSLWPCGPGLAVRSESGA